jgi:hypothetical protein
MSENEWTDESLRDLHLFNVVVRDQQQCVAYAPSLYSIDLNAFYGNLVSRQDKSLATLLAAYAAQDAAAAFRLAEACGIDLPATFPDVIISNCDQAPFLELVLQKALDDTHRLGAWALLLAEAGLRSRLVAEMLRRMPPDSRLAAAVQVSRRSCWHKGGVKSLYTQLVTLAVQLPTPPQPAFGAVALLRRVSPAGLGFYLSSAALFSPLVFPVLLVPVYALLRQLGALHRPSGFLVVTATYALFYPLMFWIQSRRAYYRTVLNLGSSLLTDVAAHGGRPVMKLSGGKALFGAMFELLAGRWMLSRRRRSILAEFLSLRRRHSDL